MRFLFGRGWVYQDEASDGTDGGAGGGDGGAGGDAAGKTDGGTVDDDAGGGEGGTVEQAAAAGAEKKEEAPKDMKSAIDAGLGYKKGPQGEALDPLTGKAKEPPLKPGEKKAEGKETETHHANGKPKKDDKGQAIDAEGKPVKAAAPKIKTAAELDLKPEERKALHAKTQARFGEVITTLKSHEATIAKQSDTIKVLAEARDTILDVMKEAGCSQDHLAGYLEFHQMLMSGDARSLEQALQVVENQRAAIYKQLGREPAGGGVDLLKDFPDLVKQVDEEEITRAAALEIAHGRREKAARAATEQRQQQQQRQQSQTEEQQKAAATKALADIEAWTGELAKSDLDYKAKEDKLLAKLDEVLKSYPPNQWVATLKLLYDGIVITKAPDTTSGGHKPLRPSGAKPGAKAPNSMLDAINQGLGYAGAEKG